MVNEQMAESIQTEDLTVSLDKVEDPRVERGKKYPLEEILFLALYATLMGVESWRGIRAIGQDDLPILRRFYPYANGIPSHQTIGRVFSLVKPTSFEQMFLNWAARLNGKNKGQHIAFDGKTLRGSSHTASGKQALHLLHACAIDNGITLAQMEVDRKTNEITAMPDMIDALDLKGTTVSADALNTQRDIAKKLVEAGADYTLALKGNHKTLNEEGDLLFRTLTNQETMSHYQEEAEKSHGRVVERTYSVLPINPDLVPQMSDWEGLQALGRVHTRTYQKGKEREETRLYLLSYTDPQRFAKSVRGHWGVEAMHWKLDVIMREDDSHKYKDNAPRNYALIRKFALNILQTNKEELGMHRARIKATRDSGYLCSLLTKAGFKSMSS